MPRGYYKGTTIGIRRGKPPANKLPRVPRKCKTCGKVVMEKITYKRRFCSMSCATRWQLRDPKKNGRWKGDDVGYVGVHLWIDKHYKKLSKCEHCGKTPKRAIDGRNKIHWANKSGKYLRRRSDWLCLCINCHWRYDKPWLKLNRNTNGRFNRAEDVERRKLEMKVREGAEKALEDFPQVFERLKDV